MKNKRKPKTTFVQRAFRFNNLAACFEVNWILLEVLYQEIDLTEKLLLILPKKKRYKKSEARPNFLLVQSKHPRRSKNCLKL